MDSIGDLNKLENFISPSLFQETKGLPIGKWLNRVGSNLKGQLKAECCRIKHLAWYGVWVNNDKIVSRLNHRLQQLEKNKPLSTQQQEEVTKIRMLYDKLQKTMGPTYRQRAELDSILKKLVDQIKSPQKQLEPSSNSPKNATAPPPPPLAPGMTVISDVKASPPAEPESSSVPDAPPFLEEPSQPPLLEELPPPPPRPLPTAASSSVSSGSISKKDLASVKLKKAAPRQASKSSGGPPTAKEVERGKKKLRSVSSSEHPTVVPKQPETGPMSALKNKLKADMENRRKRVELDDDVSPEEWDDP